MRTLLILGVLGIFIVAGVILIWLKNKTNKSNVLDNEPQKVETIRKENPIFNICSGSVNVDWIPIEEGFVEIKFKENISETEARKYLNDNGYIFHLIWPPSHFSVEVPIGREECWARELNKKQDIIEKVEPIYIDMR